MRTSIKRGMSIASVILSLVDRCVTESTDKASKEKFKQFKKLFKKDHLCIYFHCIKQLHKDIKVYFYITVASLQLVILKSKSDHVVPRERSLFLQSFTSASSLQLVILKTKSNFVSPFCKTAVLKAQNRACK